MAAAPWRFPRPFWSSAGTCGLRTAAVAKARGCGRRTSLALSVTSWVHGDLATQQVGAQDCVRDLTSVPSQLAALPRADGRDDVLLIAFFP